MFHKTLLHLPHTQCLAALWVSAVACFLVLASSARANFFSPDSEPGVAMSQFDDSSQLNQLFLFETTNNKLAKGEGYATLSLDYAKFPGQFDEYRYQFQTEYALTNRFALGGFIPVISTHEASPNVGFGDIVVYGQYKLDQLIAHDSLDLTAQVDLVFPTGDRNQLRDTGRVGVRPLLQAFKDFGRVGPGHVGAYGELGCTFSDYTDIRCGLAGSYEVNRYVAILEFYEQAGRGPAFITITPGVSIPTGSPLEISVGSPVGLNHGSPDWSIVFKASVAW